MTEVLRETPAVSPQVSLEDKYDLREGAVFMSGTQALARLPLEQRWRDQRAGLNTGGFISGYRGSPLGGYDRELWRIGARLAALNIRFQPGVNEDLAATAGGARSTSTSIPAPRSTASLASGMAKARASTAAATPSSMPTRPVPRRTAA